MPASRYTTPELDALKNAIRLMVKDECLPLEPEYLGPWRLLLRHARIGGGADPQVRNIPGLVGRPGIVSKIGSLITVPCVNC
ncbi:MAG: hypothetical protein IIC99_06620 [Chloroflexi bacterium]|nr:hypothetical protein [Chloroflexota bacterium]